MLVLVFVLLSFNCGKVSSQSTSNVGTTPFVCAAGQDCVVNCLNDQQCIYSTIDASNAKSLTLLCSGQGSCQQTKITCPQTVSGSSCNISCPSYESCYEMSITANQASDQFNLFCGGQSSCQQVQVSGGGSGNNVVNITCAQYESCYEASFDFSSSSGALYLTCQAQGSCQQVELLCSSSGPCIVSCQQLDSCYAMQFIANASSELSVQCISQSSCQSATFQCPTSQYSASSPGGVCSLLCSSAFSCYGSSILSNSNSNLCLKCQGDNACQSSQVQIGSSGSISCSSGRDSCYGVNFITTVSNSNLQLFCDYDSFPATNLQSCQAAQIECLNSVDYIAVGCDYTANPNLGLCPSTTTGSCVASKSTPSIPFTYCPVNNPSTTSLPSSTPTSTSYPSSLTSTASLSSFATPSSSPTSSLPCFCPCTCPSSINNCIDTMGGQHTNSGIIFINVTYSPTYCLGDATFLNQKQTLISSSNSQILINQQLTIIGDLEVSSGGILNYTIQTNNNPAIIVVGNVILDQAKIVLLIEASLAENEVKQVVLLTPAQLSTGSSSSRNKRGGAGGYSYDVQILGGADKDVTVQEDENGGIKAVIQSKVVAASTNSISTLTNSASVAVSGSSSSSSSLGGWIGMFKFVNY